MKLDTKVSPAIKFSGVHSPLRRSFAPKRPLGYLLSSLRAQWIRGVNANGWPCSTVFSVDVLSTPWSSTKTTERPGKSAQRFHQFSCSLWCSSCWKLGVCHMFIYIMMASSGISFPLGFMKNTENYCFIAVGIQKCMLNTFKKRCVFCMLMRFATSPAIPFHQFNLRTVLQCCHTHQHFDVCQALA